ncbi:AAA family ATPase, partial [candidate division GN15 bacterium]|nr:AAA family ATPase [candidate division GN15 bacterium]
MVTEIPRLVIAGLSGDSGKTVVSLSLLSALRQKGLTVSTFKKGPDYIDAAWLTALSQSPCRNLDTYLVSPDDVQRTFATNAERSDVALVEGNRGVFDGRDESGTNSTAELAKLLGAPVVLVVNATKTTRTVAALVKGCIDFDPGVTIAGVVLNRVAGDRHDRILRKTITRYCGVP